MQYRQATAESNQHFNNPHHLVLHCISNVSLVIALDWILKEEVSWLHTSVTVSACQWSLVTLAAESTSQHRFFCVEWERKGYDWEISKAGFQLVTYEHHCSICPAVIVKLDLLLFQSLLGQKFTPD